MVVLNFFKRKSPMFYIGLAGAIMSFITAFIYLFSYKGTRYFDSASLVFAIIACILYIALSIFSITSGLAAPIMALFSMLSLCKYVYATYMYLSEVFYHGVTLESIRMMNPAYVICIIGFLIPMLIGIVGFFVKQEWHKNNNDEIEEVKE